MLQYMFVFVVVLVGGSSAGYPDHSSGNDLGNDGNSYGYGFSGSFSNAGGPPNFAFGPGLDFSNFFSTLNRYQEDLFKNLQQIQNNIPVPNRNNFPEGEGGGSYGFGKGSSFAGSFSGGFPGSGGYPGSGGFQFVPGSGIAGSFTPNGQGASAFGSIGPDGIQQSASVFPENPNAPNVKVRFDTDQPDGFKSVFTSSSSFTSNVDGKPQTVQKSITTVNDNGKVTTYTANSP